MIIAYVIITTLILGWLAYAWSSRTTQNVFFKLFLTGMTIWGIVSLVLHCKL